MPPKAAATVMTCPLCPGGAGRCGCGCAATVVSSYIIGKMISGEIKKALVMATGALMSPLANLQGESIPSIAHAIVLERE